MPVPILLVESSPRVRMELKKAIGKTKYTVEFETDNGQDAIANYVESNPKPLVVMDMVFESGGGIETMEELQKIDSSVKIVLIHDKNSAFLVMEGTKKGAGGNIRYPFQSVDKVLEQLAIAEQGGSAGALGSEQHFLSVIRPLAVDVKKSGLLGLIFGSTSGFSDRVSVNQMTIRLEKMIKKGSKVKARINFLDNSESINGRIASVEKKASSFEHIVDFQIKNKSERERYRKHILRAATTE